jgi:hypothetical protein
MSAKDIAFAWALALKAKAGRWDAHSSNPIRLKMRRSVKNSPDTPKGAGERDTRNEGHYAIAQTEESHV